MDFRKKQENNLILGDSSKNITIFKDASFKFLYQKTERISLAIYLITNLMNVREPLKWDLRKASLELLKVVMSLSNTNLSLRDSNLREIHKKLFHLISLYEISYRSGFISQMNYQIVYNELKKLANFLSEYDKEDSNSRESLFKSDFFEDGIDELNKGQIEKDIFIKDRFVNRQYQTTSESYKTTSLKDSNIYKGQSKGQNTNMSFRNNNVPNKSKDRNNRREKIISIIKQKGSVSVKDISNIIKDTSEKTIQRELISMVEEGVLLKEGERRWSRYSMNKQ